MAETLAIPQGLICIIFHEALSQSLYFQSPRGRGCATEQKKKEKKEKKHKKDKTKVKKKDKKKKKKERACSDELSVSSSELREMFEGGSDFDMDELLS
ncbi:hypothetical protein AK812_SmicGene33829 [Symbiodinium microadriaticum]|uniref:Uncharacterized protein n=1 Tax=Symbiodinium microadriaticum TaxID=2951 RepID=A0A1Q9CQJ5_SYMMI|nr:hypothetical protein AK812_SmicGene33829 [Symbiodinium microadriaticum]